MNFKEVKNCKWMNVEHTMLDCEVNFEHLSQEFVPFTALAQSSTPHESDIFSRAASGEFGEVAEYVPPPPPTAEEVAVLVRSYRDELLRQLDAIVGNPLRWASFTQEQQQQYSAYRQALLDVPQQSGFPTNVVWPVTP